MFIKSYKNRLLLYISSTIIIFSIFIILYNTQFYYNNLLEVSNKKNLSFTKNASIAYSEWIKKNMRELDVFSNLDLVKNYNDNDSNQRDALNLILKLSGENSLFDYYYISNNSGYFLASNLKGKRSIVERNYFTRVISGQNTVSNVIKSSIDKRNVIVFSVPIYKNEKIIGALSGVKYSNSLDYLMKNFGENKYSNSYIIDENGNILSSNDIKRYNSSYKLKNIYNIKPSTKKFLGFDNVGYLNTYKSNDINFFFYDIQNTMNWKVISYSDLNEIRTKVFHSIMFEVGYITILLFLGAIFINKNSQMILEPLSSFGIIFDEVTSGNYDIRAKKYKIIEIENMSHKFNMLMEKIVDVLFKDRLTKMNNYNYFIFQLEKKFDNRNSSYNNKIGVLLFGIDNFKLLNDTFGFEICNKLLVETSELALSSLNEDFTFSRLGGDEFAILITCEDPELESYKIFKKLNNQLNNGVDYGSGNVNLSISAGVTIVNMEENYLEVMNNAYIALNKAKNRHNSSIEIFNDEIKYDIYEVAELSLLMKNAMENSEITINYQPIYSHKQNKIRGFESLIRWESKTIGIVEPVKFIPIAENNGMILPIGIFALENGIIDILKLNSKFNENFILHLNVSYIQLLNTIYINKLEELLDKYKYDPKNIVFEITEKILLDESGDIITNIRRIKRLGCRFGLDDFGSGFTSITNLNKNILSIVKIDNKLIDNFQDESIKLIIESIILIAKKFGLYIIAEGVENKNQFDYLTQNGCDLVEGHYIFKAKNIDNVIKKLEEFY
ncbi:EAL domain-containing protein [Helicovermis profundi]|uniref:Diguanylate cyclase/phosphodiesterase n=1 Tax=Helicovermis profundi TaxID=3065157 RepID=A0AAU9E3K1_9FIRM|nr:hypothetical protein HLPR_14850 [Clostridia bacterium S502]